VKFKSAPPVVAIDEAVRPERVRAPEVAVMFSAPPVRVNPFEAVRSSETVKAPLFVVVIPEAPREREPVLEVPMEIVPFAVVPEPALIETEPPVEFVPDSLPPRKFNPPPADELLVFVAGWTVREFPPPTVVISGLKFPAKANCPSCLTVKVSTPPSWLLIFKVLAAFALLIMKALAEPLLVKVKLVAVPEFDDSS
jgi:hypothetical protein